MWPAECFSTSLLVWALEQGFRLLKTLQALACQHWYLQRTIWNGGKQNFESLNFKVLSVIPDVISLGQMAKQGLSSIVLCTDWEGTGTPLCQLIGASSFWTLSHWWLEEEGEAEIFLFSSGVNSFVFCCLWRDWKTINFMFNLIKQNQPQRMLLRVSYSMGQRNPTSEIM